ncbi:FeoA domain-containing protein [Desulfovibrio inopinatus]|uniref:FeoA domain-containing protein n=1 Tax=Desulfovibrio inopinatus TaxID=102109 RepID=UPI0004006361|nr:FeoA domain-containing protein [Desulfovibrio inopinatus]
MLISLDRASIGVPLILCAITHPDLARRVSRLGLYEGATLMRLNESVVVGPIKVKGPQGDVVLSGGIAAKIVVHLDDDRRLPLLECSSGESGHIEGITGQRGVESALSDLGMRENDRITCIRRLPPMMYKVIVEKKETVQLSEGLASKVMGETSHGPTQLCSAGVGEEFRVTRILSGERGADTLSSLGIHVGSSLQLTNVATGQVLAFSHFKPVVCVTGEGLRLYFQEKDAQHLLVQRQQVDDSPPSDS